MNFKAAACGEDVEALPQAAAETVSWPSAFRRRLGRIASRQGYQPPPPQLKPLQPPPGDCEDGTRISAIDAGRRPNDSDVTPAARYWPSLFASIANKQPCMLLWLDRLTSGFFAILVVFLTVAMIFFGLFERTSSSNPDELKSVLYGVMTVIAGIAAVPILLLASTWHARIVAAFLFFVWLQMWSNTARFGLAVPRSVDELFHAGYTVSWALAIILGCCGVRLRTKALQAHSHVFILRFKGMSCSTISLLALVASAALYGLSVLFCASIKGTQLDPDHLEVWQLPLLFSIASLAASYLAFAGISCHIFFRAWRVAVGVAAVAKGRLKDDARQAMRTAFYQLLGTCLAFSTTCASVFSYIMIRVLRLQNHYPFFSKVWDFEIRLSLASALADILLALALSGVLSGSLVAAFVRERQEFQRRLLHSSKAMAAVVSESTEWNSALEQLASRGFTLQAFLDFYKGLGKDYMLHYDGQCHTTLDVVRQAIIPLSSDKRVAYASIMMKGVPTRPEKMVTHGWGNLFRDLAAAVISDALGESEYAMVSYMMDHDIESLERWIRGSDKQSAAYWVCAFSVNQHATICDQNFGNRRDSVTDELHPTCNCGHQKILNDTPPCVGGRSIRCEVNKFDDFMALMASSSASFQQVVAVDAEFTLFSRAWCVAELAVAANMGVRQTVKVHSRHSLELSLEQLKTLRIEDMQASREEDKAEILSKIPDKEEFNKELRSLLLKRLFPSWHSLDPTDQLLRLSGMRRWYDVSRTARLGGIWEAGAILAPRGSGARSTTVESHFSFHSVETGR